MLTNGELALLSPLFGLLGAVSRSLVTWMATSTGSRRQQKIDANQRRYERRAEVYENMLIEMNRAVLVQEARIKAGPDATPVERDEQARKEEARWRARAMLLASGQVRRAYNEWTELLIARWDIARLPAGRRALEHLNWLAEIDAETSEVGRIMSADLEALSALREARNWRFFTLRHQG